jgi:hypothetical protein
MTRIFAVIDVDYEFLGDMSEAASWLETHLDRSTFRNSVTAYRSLADLNYDADDKEGAFASGMMEG